jgi:TRAP-type C4-dicarboxylate transport system permease small subunit
MDVIVRTLPARLQAGLALLVHAIVLGILTVLVVQGLELAVRNWRQSSSALGVPLSVPNAAIPLTAAVMILVVLRRLLRGEAAAQSAMAD